MFDAAFAVGTAAQFAVLGVSATVTRPEPNDTPIETSLIWINRQTVDEPVGGFEVKRRQTIRVAMFDRADVPTLPKDTRVVAAEQQDGTARRWTVDRIEAIEPDVVRAVLFLVE